MADFSDIKSILSEYSSDIQDEIAQEAIRIGKDSVNELKHTSPVMRGKYRKGWSSKTEKTFSEVKVTVYNKEYQLTHLLEDGHKINRHGRIVGVAGAKPHIYPVEQKAIREYELKVEQIIGGNK